MNQARNFFDWIAVIVMWVVAVILMGGVARIAKELFCLGYGCNG